MLYTPVRNALFAASRRDPEQAHRLAMHALHRADQHPQVVAALARLKYQHPALRQELMGLQFDGPIGLAAGFDKQAEAPHTLATLFDFLECGTVLPLPQAGQDRPRIIRLPADAALINRMGFNSHGVMAVQARLEATGPVSVPLAANVSQLRHTTAERAGDDYLAVIRRLHPLVDYFVINPSSPNTPGLRRQQAADRLTSLLQRARRLTSKPLLAKLAPDLEPSEFADCLHVIARHGHGVVLTNTTLQRPGLSVRLNEAGGYSGPGLFPLVLPMVEQAAELLPRGHIIVGCGGVSSAHQAYRLLEAGADLVEVYTAFIYQGPGLMNRLRRGIVRLMKQHGYSHIQQINGRKLPPTPKETHHG